MSLVTVTGRVLELVVFVGMLYALRRVVHNLEADRPFALARMRLVPDVPRAFGVTAVGGLVFTMMIGTLAVVQASPMHVLGGRTAVVVNLLGWGGILALFMGHFYFFHVVAEATTKPEDDGAAL